jgi:hypothetical protein
MQAKVMKNIRGKNHLQQRKMSSKAAKGKKPVKELEANPKLLIAMMPTNPKFVMGKPMLTVDVLKLAANHVSSFITTTSIITVKVKA